jgi:NRAMP (natural resistance-associated macrophage protein)-like metal ion transporter
MQTPHHEAFIHNKKPKGKSFLKILGPGLITGASDDDPSGIATYAQVGAQSGLTNLWTALFTFPLMAAIQEISARIGLVTGHGLAGNIKRNYSKRILYPVALILLIANTINIGADIGGMSAASNMILPLPVWLWAIIWGVVLVVLIIRLPYHVIAKYLKYVVLTLFAYVAVPFLVDTNWGEVFRATFLPTIKFTKENITLLVAAMGTTISPYLFFWQARMEIEDKLDHRNSAVPLKHWIVTKNEIKNMEEDNVVGMFYSNAIMWFIILTTGIILHKNGITNISTAQEAAEALRPLAGSLAHILFTVGIIGAGILGIPVLAGSASYTISETFGWEEGLNKKFHEAKAFYGVIIFSTIIGVLMNFLNLNPMGMLFYAAVINGIVSPPLIAVILHMGNSKKIMGERKNHWLSNVLGGATLIVTIIATILFFVM